MSDSAMSLSAPFVRRAVVVLAFTLVLGAVFGSCATGNRWSLEATTDVASVVWAGAHTDAHDGCGHHAVAGLESLRGWTARALTASDLLPMVAAAAGVLVSGSLVGVIGGWFAGPPGGRFGRLLLLDVSVARI